MGGLRDVFWDSPKAQLDTMFKRDLKGEPSPFRGLEKGGKNMSAKQKAEFLARENAKGPVTALSPLTDRYS